MNEPSSPPRSPRTFGGHPLQAIRALDYTILFARDWPAMRKFYSEVMRFELYFEIADNWVEFRVGGNRSALGPSDDVLPRSGRQSARDLRGYLTRAIAQAGARTVS